MEIPGTKRFILKGLKFCPINEARGHFVLNRPFPCLPSLQSESKCENFVMVISSTLHMNEN